MHEYTLNSHSFMFFKFIYYAFLCRIYWNIVQFSCKLSRLFTYKMKTKYEYIERRCIFCSQIFLSLILCYVFFCTNSKVAYRLEALVSQFNTNNTNDQVFSYRLFCSWFSFIKTLRYVQCLILYYTFWLDWPILFFFIFSHHNYIVFFCYVIWWRVVSYISTMFE